jgi:hypothetical protein
MKRITSRHGRWLLVPALAALALLPLLGGCISSSKVSTAPGATAGQQLIDLDKAYKQGVITKDQYDKMRKEIIKKND